jgi:ATP-dependent protease ClpP protease subunit
VSDVTDEQLVEDTRAKLAAETAAQLTLAELHAAEARKANAEAAAAEYTAEAARVARDELLRTERKDAARDDRHHVYQFDGAVTAATVKPCIGKLSEWSRLDPCCPITVIFNSPGGSVIDGMAMWDHLAALKTAGHPLTTVTRGLAASMASILFQAGDDRIMGAESYQLIHEVSFGASGKPGDVEDTMDWINKITKRVLRIYAARSTMTEKQIAAKWARKDWTLDADECVRLGFADRIG